MIYFNKRFSADISNKLISLQFSYLAVLLFYFSHPNDDIDYTGLGDSCLATFGGHIQPFLVLEGYKGNIY